MKEKKSNQGFSDGNQNTDKENKLKEWKAPKLQIENTNNTLGGSQSCNAPGDDTWYVS